LISKRIRNEIERSIIPRDGGEFVARIREDAYSWWQYIGVFSTRSAALDAFKERHQELFGITSPFFDSHHRPHPDIAKAIGEKL